MICLPRVVNKYSFQKVNKFSRKGHDGMNTIFFKKIWHIVKDDIILAVKNFFKSGYMCENINVTSITLMPKSQHATSVS